MRRRAIFLLNFAFFNVDALDGAPGFALYYRDNDNVELSAAFDRSSRRAAGKPYFASSGNAARPASYRASAFFD
jgi:hypothetical protein